MEQILTKKLLKIGAFILLFALTGCSKDEAAAPVPKTGIELVAIGPTNFGGILVGQYRDAAIRLYNHGPEELDTSTLLTKLTAPFNVQSVAQPCASGTLLSGQNCIIAIRFYPTAPGTFTQDFEISTTKIAISGRGLVGGVMDISETHWDLGQKVAGTETRKTFTITNLGDFTIPAPTLTLIPGVSVGLNTCGSFIATHKTCSLEFVAKKTIAGYTNEQINLNAQTGGQLNITVENTVTPADPAGSISFINAPATIIADGSSVYNITTNAIKDQFGNIVADGTSVRLSANNATLLTSTPQVTTNGQINFTFRAPIVKGFATVSLLSGEANGFLRAIATSGPPSGVIEVQSYSQSITANGQTQVVFKLLPVKDQNGNVVEDGTPIYYFVSGGGTIASPFNFTVLGSAQMSLTAPTIIGSAVFQIRAGPIYDENNNIVDWRASGNYPVTYTPGLAAGTIPIIASPTAIYAVEDQNYENLGIPIRSTITVGPVRDAFGNVVAPNTQLQLNVTGGRNITYQNPTYPITVYTDDNGRFSFILAGNGIRGYIPITVSGGNNASGVFNLWAFTDSRFTPSNNILDNRFKLFETYYSSTNLPPLNLRWAEFGANDLSLMTNNDGVAFTMRTRNSTTINSYLADLEFLHAPCWFARDGFFQIGPCLRDEYQNKFSLAYNAVLYQGDDVSPIGPSHRPLLTIKNQFDCTPNMDDYPDPVNNPPPSCNVTQAGFSTGIHDPISRGGWSPDYGSPLMPGVGFLPYDNTYLAFGGMSVRGTSDDYCPRVKAPGFCSNPAPEYNSVGTCVGNGRVWTTAIQGCNNLTSCQWDNATQLCKYRPETAMTSQGTDYASKFFDMNRSNQITGSTFSYGGMNPEQLGDYPPSIAHMSTTTNGSDVMYAFGGYNSIPGGGGYNELHSYSARSGRWTTIYAEGDPNERGVNGEPSPRYQNSIAYVKENNSIYVAGGLKKYSCDEFVTKNTCHQYAACSWNDYEAINCDGLQGSGQNCWPQVSQSENVYGEFCQPVDESVCDSINFSIPPYNGPGFTLAMNECNKRPSCQWSNITNLCTLKPNSPEGGEGWMDAKDLWQLDLNPLTDSNPNNYPTWKKLCDSQEPFLGGNPSNPNPAFRTCNFPGSPAGQTPIYPDFSLKSQLQKIAIPENNSKIDQRMNMIWNPLRQKMYMSWDKLPNLVAYDPFLDAFSTPSGSLTGLAGAYQVVFHPYTGRMFAYQRGGINQSNSLVNSVEAEPHEKKFLRAEIDLGQGSKQFASTVKPIVRASGQVLNSTQVLGVEVYVYNFTTQDWVLLGTNTYNVANSVSGFAGAEISQEFTGNQARDLISESGKLNLLIVPRGDPENASRHELFVESIAVEGRF